MSYMENQMDNLITSGIMQKEAEDLRVGNTLIAEFMKVETVNNLCEFCGEDVTIKPICNGNDKGQKRTHALGGKLLKLQYHTSWKWLMPVVIKIGDYHYPDYWSHGKPEDANDYDDCAFLRTFGMRDKDGNYMVRFNASTLHSAPTLINATWLAVVDFILWYNKKDNIDTTGWVNGLPPNF